HLLPDSAAVDGKHFRSSLENDKKCRVVQLGNGLHSPELALGYERLCRHVTHVRENQTARRNRLDVPALERRCPSEEIRSVMFNQVEPPIRVQIGIPAVKIPPGRSQRTKVHAGCPFPLLAIDDLFKGSTNVATEPEARPHSVVRKIVGQKGGEL